MSDWQVGGGYNWGSSRDANNVQYYGGRPNWMYYNQYSPMDQLLLRGMAGQNNQGALADLIMGGQGFGQSRRYGMYDQYHDPAPAQSNTQTSTQQRPDDPTARGTSMPTSPDGSMDKIASGTPTRPGPSVTPGGGGGTDGGDGGSGGGGDRITDFGPTWNPNYNFTDQAPGQGGLLGGVQNYGAWNDIENRLKNDLSWQATGDLMDLERQGLDRWRGFGNATNLEKDLRQDINWQRSGDLSDLEQQEKHGFANYANATGLENEVGNAWRGVAGPGQYDPLRGDTLSGMVKNPGFSTSEKSALKASQLLPIQQALDAQRLTGDARQAATGNQAGRWGASNAMALGAAGQAAQAGRNVELDSAQMMRQDRAQGLEGLGGLQSQIDARKAQGAQGLSGLSNQQRQAGALSLQGLSNLAGKQRANQQFGIGAGMELNNTQRNALAQANQAISNMGQQQRANTQWGLGALGGLNEQKKNQQLAGLGMQKDLYDTALNQGNKDADRAAQLASLVAGGTTRGTGSGGNVGVSV